MTVQPGSEDITGLLHQVSQGRDDASQRLFCALYDELHRLAAAHMAAERVDHTLQPTALLNEAYLKLVSRDGADYCSREHFLATAAVVMRNVLVNHAKTRRAEKRGGQFQRLPLDDLAEEFEASALDLLALEEALRRLAELDPQQARIVELRFFGGLSVEQCAATLNLSDRTVQYEWAHARAWLRQQLSGD